jgi:hypothetical protein
MADNEEGGFWGRIRGNAEWDAIKWAAAAGRSAVISLLWGLTEKIRHIQVDWIGLSILFVFFRSFSSWDGLEEFQSL